MFLTFILYLYYAQNSEINHFDFAKDLGLELIAPYMRRRFQHHNIKTINLRMLGNENRRGLWKEIQCDRMEKRKTCAKCPSALKKHFGSNNCLKIQNCIHQDTVTTVTLFEGNQGCWKMRIAIKEHLVCDIIS